MKKIIALTFTFLAFTVSAETFAKCNCGCAYGACSNKAGKCNHDHCPQDKRK